VKQPNTATDDLGARAVADTGGGSAGGPVPVTPVAVAQKPTDETIKETIESIVIAFILAFVFRAYVVEAFVIPTGSMAPTLLGAHVALTCDDCGYHFKADAALEEGRGRVAGDQATCPMCLNPLTLPPTTRIGSGDRILVHKYIYSFSEPRRWDVVVFKAPHDPGMNYIKRLIGLENEELYLFEGNVYVRPLGSDGDSDWRIARKTTRPSVQRAVWQPIYHSSYIPRQARSFPSPAWRNPWQAAEGQESLWDLERTRSYRYTGLQPGSIRFDFAAQRAGEMGMMYPYNQLKGDAAYPAGEPIEDIRLAVTIVPQRAGVGASLSTTARLDNPDIGFGPERLTATLAPDGTLTLEAAPLEGGDARTLFRRHVAPLRAGRSTTIEFWYVDQEASVWIDGSLVRAWRYDLPDLQALRTRRGAAPFPRVEIGVSGPAVLHDVQLDRDLNYTSYVGGRSIRGGLQQRETPPLRLGPDEFFCVGDNAPRSFDSRLWDRTDPWVAATLLAERDDPDGIVPRELMMGRAFFVYFPAPYGVRGVPLLPLPNFGEMRFIE
jgi:signal peptidase I